MFYAVWDMGEGVGFKVLQASGEELDGGRGASERAPAQAGGVRGPQVRDEDVREEVCLCHPFEGKARAAGAVGKILLHGAYLRKGEN